MLCMQDAKGENPLTLIVDEPGIILEASRGGIQAMSDDSEGSSVTYWPALIIKENHLCSHTGRRVLPYQDGDPTHTCCQEEYDQGNDQGIAPQVLTPKPSHQRRAWHLRRRKGIRLREARQVTRKCCLRSRALRVMIPVDGV